MIDSLSDYFDYLIDYSKSKDQQIIKIMQVLFNPNVYGAPNPLENVPAWQLAHVDESEAPEIDVQTSIALTT